MTDRAAVGDWVDRYLVAWDSNAAADVRALFTADASYRFHPWDEPVVGHDAITAAWLDDRDEAGDHSFVWEVLAVDGDTAVVQAHTAYVSGSGAGRTYENLWVLRLAPDGRAIAFTEWYMEREPRS
jgi:ketosteroid isomerase-like protein